MKKSNLFSLLAAATLVAGTLLATVACSKTKTEQEEPTQETIEVSELLRTSHSWDEAPLPDYPEGKPELVAVRYVFPVGQKLGWHHHEVMNYGIVEQGELTIIGLDGKEKVVHQGEAVVEMVGTIHHGENRGSVPVILNMFYISQEGKPLAVQHPEIELE